MQYSILTSRLLETMARHRRLHVYTLVKALNTFQASAHTFLQAKKNPKILTFVGLSDFKYC
ncbi:hypothetical protein EMIT051CA3_30558 [Pseudomonas chlororaphis]